MVKRRLSPTEANFVNTLIFVVFPEKQSTKSRRSKEDN
jgi:hypothetical protein